MSHGIVSIYALITLLGAGAPDGEGTKNVSARVPEIDAKCWFNAQPVRIHDAPRLILLEFWSGRSRESREFVHALESFYRAYREQASLLIVALTGDECEDVRSFIHREKIEYKVGGETRSSDDYGVKELPAVILIDPKGPRIIARWSGREVKPKAIAKAILDFLGPPPGTFPSSGALLPEERENLLGQIEAKGDELATITSQILTLDGEIPAEALSPLDRFYEANLFDEPKEDNAVTRAQRFGRSEMMTSEETGYERLFASGRLSEAAKAAIRDRVLQIAEKDPSPSVRLNAGHALGRYIGRPEDAALLEALRGLYQREQDPYVKASLDRALEDLGPSGAAKRQEAASRPNAARLRRMVAESPDPGSGPWAEAHAYRQTVAGRTTDQLLQDFWAFRDPPGDEGGRQNATLKRDAAFDELDDRIRLGKIQDQRVVKDYLTRVLSEEPDPYIRNFAVWSGLKTIAERGGRETRTEIVDLLEKRLPVEPDRYVKASLEAAISELKGK